MSKDCRNNIWCLLSTCHHGIYTSDKTAQEIARTRGRQCVEGDGGRQTLLNGAAAAFTTLSRSSFALHNVSSWSKTLRAGSWRKTKPGNGSTAWSRAGIVRAVGLQLWDGWLICHQGLSSSLVTAYLQGSRYCIPCSIVLGTTDKCVWISSCAFCVTEHSLGRHVLVKI